MKLNFITLLVVLGLSGLTSPLLGQACSVFIQAEGTFRATLEDAAPPIRLVHHQVSYLPIEGNRTIMRSGSQGLCNRNEIPPRNRFTFYGSDRDGRYYHLLNQTAGAMRGMTERTSDPHYDEFTDLIRMAQSETLQRAVFRGMVNMAFEVLSQFPAVKALNIPRTLLLNSIRQFINAGLAGGPEGLERAARDQTLWLVRQLAREGVSNEVLRKIEEAVPLGFKILEEHLKVTDAYRHQSMGAFADENDCSWHFSSNWDPFSGRFRMNFHKVCGEMEERRAVRSINMVDFNPDRAYPGDAVRLSLSGVDFQNNPVSAASVEIDGLEAIMEEGADYQVLDIPGFQPEVTFTVANPRRDTDFPLTIRMTDDDGFVAFRQATYTILNTGPEITGLDPDDTAADPGGMMEFSGITLSVTDDNADVHKPHELHPDRITLSGQPQGLSTVPGFSSFDPDEVTLVDHDPDTGDYLFLLSRSGRVDIPHPHGIFTNSVIVEDDRGETARSPLTYRVHNVAPVIEQTWVEPRRYLDSGNPVEITFHALIRDNNGAEDIAAIEMDVSSAAGVPTIYTLNNGLLLTEESDVLVRVQTPAFMHTVTPGYHTITVEVLDHPDSDGHFNSVEAADRIHVGNLPPQIGIHGLIYDSGVAMADSDALLVASTDSDRWISRRTVDERQLCPGQAFTVGAWAEDPEGHPFIVIAILNGVETILERAPGEETFTGELIAPSEPGEYLVGFVAQETAPEDHRGEVRTLPITVHPCDDGEEEPVTHLDQGDEPAIAPDPVEDPVTPPDPGEDPEPTPGPEDEPETDSNGRTAGGGGSDGFLNLFPSFDFGSFSGIAGLKLDFATRNRFRDAVCDQTGLMECHVAGLSAVFVAFAELDVWDLDLSDAGIGTLPVSAGLSLTRSRVHFEQYYQYGIAGPFPYQIDGHVDITTLDLYGLASRWFDLDLFSGSSLGPYARLGLTHIWNNGSFNYMSDSESFGYGRSHRGIHFTGGIGTDLLFDDWPVGLRLNLDYMSGGADANFKIGLGMSYSF